MINFSRGDIYFISLNQRLICGFNLIPRVVKQSTKVNHSNLLPFNQTVGYNEPEFSSQSFIIAHWTYIGPTYIN